MPSEGDESGVSRWDTICRECAEVGAAVPGNDGWVRHDECAREKNEWPHILSPGTREVLGASVWVFEGGKVRVVPSLRHSTSRLGVKQLAARLADCGEDYDTLHPEVTARV